MSKAKQSKSLEIFIKTTGASKGTYDVLRLLGETGPRTIDEWKKVAKLANSKPGRYTWDEWKKKHMSEAEKRSEQNLKEYKKADREKAKAKAENESESD